MVSWLHYRVQGGAGGGGGGAAAWRGEEEEEAERDSLVACEAVFGEGEGYVGGVAGRSGHDLPEEHASLFRFEGTDWRWDERLCLGFRV